jgi:hypothetical protein
MKGNNRRISTGDQTKARPNPSSASIKSYSFMFSFWCTWYHDVSSTLATCNQYGPSLELAFLAAEA